MAATPHPAAAKTAAAAIDPLDLYDVRGMLSEEERLVQDSVARLVDAEVLPVIRKAFEEHRFPQGAGAEAGRAGTARFLDPGL